MVVATIGSGEAIGCCGQLLAPDLHGDHGRDDLEARPLMRER
jgi:hypothetical protein